MFAVIDYDMGNLKSIANALKALGVPHEIAGTPEVLRRATAIILPGVGAFGDGMKSLERRGLLPVLNDKVLRERTPYLGICLGMQFLADASTEHGEHAGLGWIAGRVARIEPGATGLKVPHMGWNGLQLVRPASPLMGGVTEGTAVYFLHSYHFAPADTARDCVVATTDHGGTLVAAVERDHIFGVQFHPEKSQGAGLAILKNFADFAARHAQEKTDPVAARS
jgi:glutamine amidotransferase